MTYQVLALKWRPQRFEEVVGQEHVTRTLQNAIELDRVPHAFLFTGTRGIGKTTTARLLAKALVCEKGPAREPCNECRHCAEVTAGKSLDVLEIDGASNRGIDEIRDLRENVKYAPAAARFKVYIIDEVHMLTKEAFNALLKTLEEPPPHVKFIFATTEISKVPITIQSRCQRFDFRLMNREEIRAALARIAEAEGITIGDAALSAVAGAAEGSLRDGESLLDQVVAFCGREVKDADVSEALGIPEEETVREFVTGLLERRGADCIRILDRVSAAGLDPRAFTREVLTLLRHLAVLRADPGLADLVPLSVESVKALRELAAGVDPGRIQSLFDIFLRTESETRYSSFPRMVQELAVIRSVRLEEVEAIDTLLARLEDLAARLGPGEAAPTPSQASPPPATGPATGPAATGDGTPPRKTGAAPRAKKDSRGPAASSSGGAGILRDLAKKFQAAKKMSAASFLEHGRVTKAEEGVLEIGFEEKDSFFLDTLGDQENMGLLREAAAGIFGRPVEVRLSVLAGGGEAARPSRERDGRDRRRKEALEHPAVIEALGVFQAQVVEVKPI